ncbi:MAG TPA: proton-conducting transporter membrane subunit [Candidatus Limnocylindrales bacterium]|nr:proton-conducting transporter membrane subunit [Candidatus Limnocylindrales bacterium]
MELILLLAIAAFGATASGFGLARGGREGRVGAVLGGLSLLGVVAVSFALTAPRVGAGEIPPGIGVLDGRLIPNNYMRLVIALWALDGLLIVLIAWLASGLAGLRGLMPAVLASIAGGSVALAATNLVLGAAAAGATGLVALLVLLAFRDPGGIGTAARELRVTMLTTVLLMSAVVLGPLAGGLAVRGATGGGSGLAAAPPVADGAPALVGLVVLAVALAVAIRIGVIPFHLRVPQLTDVAPPIALPLLLAWVPLPLAVVGLAAVDLLVAPLANLAVLSLNGEQLIIIAVVLVTLVGASLAAILQDDIRHTTGYLVIADGAFVLLGLAALTPDAWGPARIWLVTLAATKTAVATWAAVVNARFGSHHLPDLRGWVRRSPLLGAALLVATVASFGLPGWAAYDARITLAQLSGGPPLDALLVVLGFLTLPTYLRLLAVGIGRPTSRVDRAAPERIVRGRRTESLPVELEGAAPAEAEGRAVASRDAHANAARRAARRSHRMASKGATSTGRRLMRAIRRDATELTAAAVLTLAILAALTSWGVLDIGGASSEPAPITTNAASD